MSVVLPTSLLYNKKWWWWPSTVMSTSHWTYGPVPEWLLSQWEQKNRRYLTVLFSPSLMVVIFKKKNKQTRNGLRHYPVTCSKHPQTFPTICHGGQHCGRLALVVAGCTSAKKEQKPSGNFEEYLALTGPGGYTAHQRATKWSHR